MSTRFCRNCRNFLPELKRPDPFRVLYGSVHSLFPRLFLYLHHLAESAMIDLPYRSAIAERPPDTCIEGLPAGYKIMRQIRHLPFTVAEIFTS